MNILTRLKQQKDKIGKKRKEKKKVFFSTFLKIFLIFYREKYRNYFNVN